jgi:single-stranded DNA-binding protein
MLSDLVRMLGYLVADPVFAHDPDGVAVCTFGISADPNGGAGGGPQPLEGDVWFLAVMRGQLAEDQSGWLRKGTLVSVVGRIALDAHGFPLVWRRQDGAPHVLYKLIASSVQAMPVWRRAPPADVSS